MLEKCEYVNNICYKIKCDLFDVYEIQDIADLSKKADFEDYLKIREEACERIESLIPERCNNLKTCEYCPFKHICLPPEIRENRAKIYTETEEFIDKLITRDLLKKAFKEYTDLDKKIKEYLKQRNQEHFFIASDTSMFEITVTRGKKTTVNIEKIEV